VTGSSPGCRAERRAARVHTLARGEIVDWYPYPFVDVATLGYGGVIARSAGLTLGFAFAALVLLWAGNRRARPWAILSARPVR
jgi:hypothetical protein